MSQVSLIRLIGCSFVGACFILIFRFKRAKTLFSLEHYLRNMKTYQHGLVNEHRPKVTNACINSVLHSVSTDEKIQNSYLKINICFVRYITEILPIILSQDGNEGGGMGNVAAIRTFRVLRALKTVAVMPGINKSITGLYCQCQLYLMC